MRWSRLQLARTALGGVALGGALCGLLPVAAGATNGAVKTQVVPEEELHRCTF